jgi:HAD superfamily hydrolase (TIGR01490 family)
VNDSSDNTASDCRALSDGGASCDRGAETPAVAFFDLDGTLVIGQTTLLLVKFLRKVGVVSWAFLLGTGLWFLGYKAGLVKVTDGSREKGAGVFKGLTEGEVAALMARFTEEILIPRLHPAAAAALAEHLAEGDLVAVISAALAPVVESLCGRLGVDEFVGTPCEVVDGRFSGRLDGPTPHADEKARFAAAFMSRWGADPSDCWAYADHGTDLTLLRSVGHPVAVRPRPDLLSVAREAGWPILP